MFKATQALCPVCQRFYPVAELAGVLFNNRQAYVLSPHPSLAVAGTDCGGGSARVAFPSEVKFDERGPL